MATQARARIVSHCRRLVCRRESGVLRRRGDMERLSCLVRPYPFGGRRGVLEGAFW